MTEPRFDWEADRDEWERFREMDRTWKRLVDDVIASQTQMITTLQERVSALERLHAELLIRQAQREQGDDSR